MRKELLKCLLSDAINGSRNNKTIDSAFLYHGFAVSMILTTLPVDSLNVLASFAALSFLLAILFKARHFLKNPVIWILLSASIASGCAGPYFHDNRIRQADFCYDIVGSACKQQTIQMYGLLGLGLQNATPDEAARRGNIKKIVVVDQARGYGIISLIKITVMGS